MENKTSSPSKLLFVHAGRWGIFKTMQMKEADMYSIAYCEAEEGCFRQVHWLTSPDMQLEAEAETEAAKKLVEALDRHFAYKAKPEWTDADGNEQLYVLYRGKWQWVKKNKVAKM